MQSASDNIFFLICGGQHFCSLPCNVCFILGRFYYIVITGLFNVYSESVMRTLQDIPEISVGRHGVNKLAYANDTVLQAENEMQ